ncbi:MAG: histidine phosphatase family protein [Candidatus Puniceispirillaceae bacterium]
MSDDYGFSVYMVRHGPVEKTLGHLPAYDAPLASDQPALTALAPYLPNEADFFISPLRRTKQSFEILSSGQPHPSLLCDARLEEQNFGNWHGADVAAVWQEITHLTDERHPTSFVTSNLTPPNGTSFDHVFAQCGSFLSDLIKKKPKRPQIIVAHAGTIKALLGQMMGMTASQALMLTIDHGSVSLADYIYPAKNTTETVNTEKVIPETVIPWQIQTINHSYLR